MKADRPKAVKTIEKISRLVVLCFVYFVLFLVIRNSLNFGPNDSDLIFNRPEVTAESNAFCTLSGVTNELYWPAKLSKKLEDLSQNTNWDDSLAAEILATNQACLDLFDKAMQQPVLLVPDQKSFEDDLSYLGTWKNLARLKSIQIFSLYRAQKDREAFDGAFEIIRFGHRIENAGGPLLHYLVGSSIKSIGFGDMRQMLAETTLSEADLGQLIHNLNDYGPNQEGLTNALKVEYKIDRNYIDKFAEGIIPDTTNTTFERAMASLIAKPLLDPGKTKVIFAQGDRFMFTNFSRPFGEIDWASFPGIKTNATAFEQIVSGNALGNILLEMLDPVMEAIARAKTRDNNNVAATQLLLALKIYKMRHGTLPNSLSELVPEFFPQVPLDDYDGKPFRYLPEKKTIYSVGPCLKDLGGKEREKGDSPDYNVPFKIEF